MGRRSARFLLAVGSLAVALLAGCSADDVIRKMTPPEDEVMARYSVDMLREKKLDKLQLIMDPSLQDKATRDTLATMAGMFPGGEPISSKKVGVSFYRAVGLSRTDLTLEYHFSGGWVLTEVVVQRKDGAVTVTSFHVSQIADSLENTNRFTLRGKGRAQYSVLALSLAATFVAIGALIVCLRSKLGPQKWAWALACFAGAGKLAVNWTTGHLNYQVIGIGIPPGEFWHAFYGPWTISVYLPVGAVAFLLLHDRLERMAVARAAMRASWKRPSQVNAGG